MYFKPTYIKCIICNTFYKYEDFFIGDINNMKIGKLIYCKNCKLNHSVFQEDLQ